MATIWGTSSALFFGIERLTLLLMKISLLIVALSLAVGIYVLRRYNNEQLTTRFSHTLEVTQNPTISGLVEKAQDGPAQKKLKNTRLRLDRGPSGRLQFGIPQDFGEQNLKAAYGDSEKAAAVLASPTAPPNIGEDALPTLRNQDQVSFRPIFYNALRLTHRAQEHTSSVTPVEMTRETRHTLPAIIGLVLAIVFCVGHLW